MTINGVSGISTQSGAAGIGAGAGAQMDAVSKDLQNQIANLQKQLQELSSNQEIPTETKMKKRQELQKQMSDLEVQLRQHQMEVKREAAMKKREQRNGMDELLGTKQQEKQENMQSTGMSAGSMEALISADMSMRQAGVHGGTARRMEGKARVLESEISLDSGRGGSSNLAYKEEQLAETREKSQQAAASRMSSLARANKSLQEASKEEQKDKEGKTDETTDKAAEDKQSGIEGGAQTVEGKKAGQQAAEARENDSPSKMSVRNTFDAEMPGVAFSRGYQPVDIKL